MRHEFTDDTAMPWGEHKGTPMIDVPPAHLHWLLEQRWLHDWPELHRYLKRRQDTIRAAVNVEVGNDDEGEGYTTFDEYMKDYRGF